MEEGRRRLFEIYCKGVEISEELDWEFLLRKSEGYSGSDIASVCRDAAMMPLRKKMMELRQKGLGLQELEKMKSDFHVPLGMNDFKDALANVQKSVSPDDLEPTRPTPLSDWSGMQSGWRPSAAQYSLTLST